MQVPESDYVGREFLDRDPEVIREEENVPEIPNYGLKEYQRISDKKVHSPRTVSDTCSEKSEKSEKSHRRRQSKKDLGDDDDTSIFDDNMLYLFGLVLLMLTFAYLYWESNECNIPPKDETNETMQYAIDQINVYFQGNEKSIELEPGQTNSNDANQQEGKSSS